MSPTNPYDVQAMLDSIPAGLGKLIPEGILILTFLVAIIFEIFPGRRFSKVLPFWAMTGLVGAAVVQFYLLVVGFPPQKIAMDMLWVDRMSGVVKLLVFVPAFISMATFHQSETKSVHTSDGKGTYFLLMIALAIGLSFLTMANHLMMVFLALEMASLPAYVLTAYSRENKKGTESGLKYVIFGCFSSGIMAYGISWIFGLAGSLDPTTADFAAQLQVHPIWMQGVAWLLVFVGLAFKVGLFPFHFWVPDVYEGAPFPVASFFSVGPKVAVFVVLLRLTACLHLGFSPGLESLLLAGFSAMALGSILLGNLSAMFQTNVRRMLAFSSIAHSGYLMVGICTFSVQGGASVLFYLTIYTLMTYGAFMASGWLEERKHSQTLDDLKGLSSRAPALAVIWIVLWVSLSGLPPTAGFIAKLEIFLAATQSYQGAGNLVLLVLLIAVVLNTVLALFYYLRPPAMMLFGQPKISSPIALHGFQGFVLVFLAVIVLILGIFAFDALSDFMLKVVDEFHSGVRF
jgi:NADH-quinone oxidoreductase subunit N